MQKKKGKKERSDGGNGRMGDSKVMITVAEGVVMFSLHPTQSIGMI